MYSFLKGEKVHIWGKYLCNLKVYVNPNIPDQDEEVESVNIDFSFQKFEKGRGEIEQ